jgi:transposase
VVILDNAAAHKCEEAIERIEQTGAKVLFLPPYCPELNPIEYTTFSHIAFPARLLFNFRVIESG